MANPQLPESLEDRLKAATAEVTSLERQLDNFYEEFKLRVATGTTVTLAREADRQELIGKLNEARQRQLSLLLRSISDSSNRLESATRNLQQSSESQVRVAESQVRVSESQSRAINDLLRSSHRLEQFAIYLLILNVVNIFILMYTTGQFNGLIGIASFYRNSFRYNSPDGDCLSMALTD